MSTKMELIGDVPRLLVTKITLFDSGKLCTSTVSGSWALCEPGIANKPRKYSLFGHEHEG